MPVRASPHHDAEESFEICGIHDDDHLIGRKLLLLNHDAFQLPLHPLCAMSVLLGNLRVGLLAVGELLPDPFRLRG